MTAVLAATRIQMQFKFLIGLTTAVGTAGILWIGTQHALRGDLTIGNIVIFLYYVAALYTPLEAIMYTTSTIQGASGSARRVMEILARERDVADRPHATALAFVRGNVRFDDVTFGYNRAAPCCETSLDVKCERIAIMAPRVQAKALVRPAAALFRSVAGPRHD
jgi:ABC-type multidrug transport system fused ATPase/permease subunit